MLRGIENNKNPLVIAIIFATIFFVTYTLSKYFLFKSKINWLQAIISTIIIGIGYFFLKLYLESKKGL
jgi:hypothetical protein